MGVFLCLKVVYFFVLFVFLCILLGGKERKWFMKIIVFSFLLVVYFVFLVICDFLWCRI